MTMNVDNQLLMHVKAGHLPPKETIKLILGEFKPNVIGFSVQNVLEMKDGTKQPELAIIREDLKNVGVDELMETFTKAKDWPLTAYFGSLRQNYKPEDIQPFVLQDDNNDPFMSLFIEGTLVGHDDPAEHTEHYNYVNGILIPKLLEWCNDLGDKPDFVELLNAKLKGDLFKKEFMMHVGHRAVLHMMPIEGDVINLGKNELGTGDLDWGWLSQKIEAKATTASVPAEPVVTKSRFSFGKNKASVPSEVDPLKENPPGVHTVGDPKNNPPPLPDVEKGEKDNGYPAKKQTGSPALAARPPAWLKKNDDLKLWYKIVGGSLHAQWSKRLPTTVVDFEAVKIDNLDAFKTYALKKTVEPASTSTTAGKPPAETAKQDAKVVEAVATGVLTPKSIDNILEFVAKHLDTCSKEIIAPKEIQEQETVLPKFSDAVGLKRDEMINWPIAALKKIGEDDVNALLCYAIEWRSAYRALKSGALEAGTKVTAGATTTTTKSGDGTTKTESVAHVEPPKPAAKSRFSFGKKAT